jgi:hypothetical protein
MNYLITYVINTTDFIAELETVAPELILTDKNTGKKTWKIQTTPVVHSKNGTLAMSILTDEQVDFIKTKMSTIKILGTYDEIFADTGEDGILDIYKSVYDWETPIVYTDKNGDKKSYIRPKKIGEFLL